MKCVKPRSFGLSTRDVEKLDMIKSHEQIASRSEVVRRLIDKRFDLICKDGLNGNVDAKNPGTSQEI